jgi:hypothetical protein
MKKVIWLSLLFVAANGFYSLGQTVGRKPPRILLKDYSSKEEDGNIEFEVDVRMVDCISYIEIKNPEARKPIQVPVSESDYFVDEKTGEDIYLRLSIGSLKKMLRKEDAVNASLVIYSKSGKPVYTNRLSINRAELLRSAGSGGQL